MKGHGTKFGRKKEQAVVALLTQRNIDEAAKMVDVAPNTLLRWMKDPVFDAEYRQGKRAVSGQAMARLQQASGAAVSTVLKIMVDANVPPSTRLRAADIVMDQTAKAIELEEIEARVRDLEFAAEASKDKGRFR